MKKILPIALVSFLGLAACNKVLDILPTQSVDENVVLSSDQNVKRALNGAYDALSSSNLLGGNVQLYNELLAADAEILWQGTFNQPREIFGKNILTNNSYVSGTWLDGYEAINIANNVLSAIDVVLPADKDRVTGESQFIRGVTYFELVKLYALPYSAGNAGTNLGLPIVLTPTREINESSFVSRATVEATYQQIISDLTSAEALVPINNTVYATKRAAAGYLSRVYLQMGEYEEARDAANRAIGYSPNVSLQNSFSTVFNRDAFGGEDIFAIEVNDQDGANNMHLFWSTPATGGRDGDVVILDKLLDMFEIMDQRSDLYYNFQNGPFSKKWELQYKNLSVMRLAELFLTRAEANLRLGTQVGATPLADVNRIRVRAGLLPFVGVVTLDQILRERKLELIHEGQGISDAKRLQLTVDGLPYNSNRLVLPIPLREINANPNLDQNNGY